MAFIHFVQNHRDDIRNYVQPAINWRKGIFAAPVAKAEATGGDFAEVIRSLQDTLTRDDVVTCFQEDLYKGFVAAIVWGGLNRYHAEEIARRNDRVSVVPKLERLRALLRESDEDSWRIQEAVKSMQPRRENKFYGIGSSYFTKLLYFLSADMELGTRPLIYDENMKAVHCALMPEYRQNPFCFYVPCGDKVSYTYMTRFEDVYIPYCELLGSVAGDLDVDVTNLESWLFGWQANIMKDRPNPRVVARQEVERMEGTGLIYHIGGFKDHFSAIGVSRIFYDNNLLDSDLHVRTDIGTDIGHPIVINEPDNYVGMEYIMAETIFRIRKQSYKQTRQRLIEKDGRYIDELSFQVCPKEDVMEMVSDSELDEFDEALFDFDDTELLDEILKDLEKEDRDGSLPEDGPGDFWVQFKLYFDITAGYTGR